jgi:cyclophilin family peptidyl-prolyl cis-trans isomerase
MRRLGIVAIALMLLGGFAGWIHPADAEENLLLVLRAAPEGGETLDAGTLDATARVIERRIEGIGIADPVVKTHGDDEIYALLPGIGEDQIETTVFAIVGNSTIEIVDTNGELLEAGTVIRTTLDTPTDDASPIAGSVYETIVSGADIQEAFAADSDNQGSQIVFTLNDEAAARFFTYTSEHIGEPLAIVYNKTVLSSPIINAPIDRQGVIIGVAEEDVPVLVNQINSGVLTVPLTVVSTTILDDVPPASVATPIAGASPVAVSGCWTADQQTSVDPPQWSSPPAMTIDPSIDYTATVETNYGEFTVELFADEAPLAVNNFVCLARAGYFDNTTFHRVIPGFVIQGGDPTGTGRGNPGYHFANDPIERSYDVGAMVMANRGPDTNGSQFFIVVGTSAAQLPKDYPIFGEVIDRFDVVETISKVPVEASASGERSKPVNPVTVERVTVVER